jgi:hypothetical protein
MVIQHMRKSVSPSLNAGSLTMREVGKRNKNELKTHRTKKWTASAPR